MLSREEIATLVAQVGLQTYFRETIKKGGMGVSYTYVKIYKQINKQRVSLSLGKLEPLQEMTPDLFLTHVQNRWQEVNKQA